MSLLDSARDFLIESLEDYQKDKLAFSILHAVTATELILKERLSRIHPNLIYRKIDSPYIVREHTIGLQDLPQRLKNFGVSLGAKEIQVIRTVSKWRHEIVHHMPTFSHQHVTNSLGLLYDFLARFLENELQLEFRKLIPKSLFKTVDGLLKEWSNVKKEAKQKALKEGNIVQFQECPICGVLGTICSRVDKKAFCHLCESDLQVGECPICHKNAIDTNSDFEGNIYHRSCLDDIGQHYMEMWREAQLDK